MGVYRKANGSVKTSEWTEGRRFGQWLALTPEMKQEYDEYCLKLEENNKKGGVNVGELDSSMESQKSSKTQKTVKVAAKDLLRA